MFPRKGTLLGHSGLYRLPNNPLMAAGVSLLMEGSAGNASLSLLHRGLGHEGLELLDCNQPLQGLNMACLVLVTEL